MIPASTSVPDTTAAAAQRFPVAAVILVAGSLATLALIGVLAAMLYGVIAFAATLARRGPVVVFGVAAYGFGVAAMIFAMLIDGFVTAPLAQRLLDVHQLGGGTAAFALAEFGIQLLTKAGFCGMGVAMCCLSWSQPRANRVLTVLKVLALASGPLPVAAIVAGGVQLAPHSLAIVAGLQALWYCAAGVHLWRHERPSR